MADTESEWKPCPGCTDPMDCASWRTCMNYSETLQRAKSVKPLEDAPPLPEFLRAPRTYEETHNAAGDRVPYEESIAGRNALLAIAHMDVYTRPGEAPPHEVMRDLAKGGLRDMAADGSLCYAIQYSGQSHCAPCGLTWDGSPSNPDRPACGSDAQSLDARDAEKNWRRKAWRKGWRTVLEGIGLLSCFGIVGAVAASVWYAPPPPQQPAAVAVKTIQYVKDESRVPVLPFAERWVVDPPKAPPVALVGEPPRVKPDVPARPTLRRERRKATRHRRTYRRRDD